MTRYTIVASIRADYVIDAASEAQALRAARQACEETTMAYAGGFIDFAAMDFEVAAEAGVIQALDDELTAFCQREGLTYFDPADAYDLAHEASTTPAQKTWLVAWITRWEAAQ